MSTFGIPHKVAELTLRSCAPTLCLKCNEVIHGDFAKHVAEKHAAPEKPIKSASARLWDLNDEELRVEACIQYASWARREGVEQDGFHRVIFVASYIAGASRGWFQRHQKALSECYKCEERYPGGKQNP